MQLIDLTNKRFGRLLVLNRAPNKNGKVYWLCQCDCGNIKEISRSNLQSNHTKSCGCIHSEQTIKNSRKDLTNQRFNKLLVKSYSYTGDNKKAFWLCECDCGKQLIVCGTSLTSGNTSSCGICLKSKGEEKIFNLLSENNINFKTQYSFKDLIGDCLPLRFDFAIFNKDNQLLYLIEYDGIQHFKDTGWQNFNKTKEYDNKKNLYCEEHNIPLIRIPYYELDILDFNRISHPNS